MLNLCINALSATIQDSIFTALSSKIYLVVIQVKLKHNKKMTVSKLYCFTFVSDTSVHLSNKKNDGLQVGLYPAQMSSENFTEGSGEINCFG